MHWNHKSKKNIYISKLTVTTKHFFIFHLLAEFGKVNSLPNEITVELDNDEI